MNARYVLGLCPDCEGTGLTRNLFDPPEPDHDLDSTGREPRCVMVDRPRRSPKGFRLYDTPCSACEGRRVRQFLVFGSS